MTSEAKIAANRSNAQHSTGPRTDAGKAASSMNHLATGLYSSTLLLPGEDPQLYQQIYDAYLACYQPADASEFEMVDQLVATKWKLRRVELIEDRCMQAVSPGADPDKLAITYNRISQIRNRMMRQWSRLDKELKSRRPQPLKEKTNPQPPAPKPKAEKPKALTKQEIANRDSRFRPEGMHMGAIEVRMLMDPETGREKIHRIWKNQAVDEFPPEAYIQEGEEDPNPPGGKDED